jgi:hypothetical protein
MVGRPKKLNKPEKKPSGRKPYKLKEFEQRGLTYKEPPMIKSFWKKYTMDQVQAMSDDEIMQAVDEFLDEIIARNIDRDKTWDYPITDAYLRIASFHKK